MAFLENGIFAYGGEVDIGSVIFEALKLLDHFQGIMMSASCVNDHSEWFGGQSALGSPFSFLLEAIDF